MCKILVGFIVLTFLVSACGQHPETYSPTQTLVVVAYDRSLSTNNNYLLSQVQLDSLYNRVERKGGGVFTSVFIQTNSSLQIPITASIPECVLLPVSGLSVHQEKIKTENRKRQTQADIKRNQFFRDVAPNLLVQQNDSFTDIDGSLKMVQLVLNEVRFANYRKVVILITDGQQDLPGQGSRPIKAIDLNAEEIHLIRPQSESLLKALGQRSVKIHATINEAFHSI